MAVMQTGSDLRDSLADVHLGDRISDAAFHDGYTPVADHAATLVKGHLDEYAAEFSYHEPNVLERDYDGEVPFTDGDAFMDRLGAAVQDILVRVYEEAAPHFHADVASVDRAAARDWAAIRTDLTVAEDGDGIRLDYDRA